MIKQISKKIFTATVRHFSDLPSIFVEGIHELPHTRDHTALNIAGPFIRRGSNRYEFEVLIQATIQKQTDIDKWIKQLRDRMLKPIPVEDMGYLRTVDEVTVYRFERLFGTKRLKQCKMSVECKMEVVT